MQLDVAQTGATGAARVSLDGAPVTDLMPATVNTPVLSAVYLGADFYGNGSAIPDYTVWLDEIIVDDRPTTCDE